MRLAKLKEEARKILELENSSKETNTFLVKSGGIPNDYVGIKDFIIHQSHDFKYKTQMCGCAYESETVVECSDTKINDAKGRRIYLLPNGETFVWNYRCGSIYNFDKGCFEHPLSTH